MSLDFSIPSASDPVPIALPGWKRVEDLTLLFLLIPALFLVMGGVAALILVVSPGPLLFVQERAGFRGRRFRCYKFRSMRVDADSSAHREYLARLGHDQPMTKLDLQGDQRLIKFGGLLRSTGLDELPQLYNVLRGEMSLVGPRPCTLYELEKYQNSQISRFHTVPGLTGLWQVSGKNNTTFNQMVRYDMEYVRRRSLPLDLWIITKTIGVIARQITNFLKTRLRLTPTVPTPEDG